MKKVVFCLRMSHDDSYKGGVVSIIQSYINAKKIFNKNNIDISIFDFQIKKNKLFKNSKINNLFYWFKQRKELKNYLNKNKDIILNIHTSRNFLFLKDVFLCKMAKEKYNISTVLTIHVGNLKTVFEKLKIVRPFLINIMNKNIDTVIFLSNEIKKEFIKFGLKEEKCRVLYNFHDLEEKKSDFNEKNNIFQILFVGAIHKEKGIIELLEAINKIKNLNIKLHVCGKITDKTIEEKFEELIKNLNKKVKVHGYVSGKEKAELFGKADVLILPSYHEGLPLVILEAMSSKTAIISTSVGATPEILDQNNVKWVKVGSSIDIENAIKSLYFNLDELNKIKENNFEKSKQFSIESHIYKLCNIYKGISEE